MKIYSIKYAYLVVDLVDKLVDIFRVNGNVTAHNRQEILDRYLIFTEYLFKVGINFYFLASFGYFIYPIYKYKKYNEIIPILPCYLPFVDENTSTGFTILTTYHLNVIILGALGTACSDFSFTMVIVNVPVLGKIFGDNIIDLNDISKQTKPNLLMQKTRLLNIFLQHREITEWVRAFEFCKLIFFCFSNIDSNYYWYGRFIDILDTTFFKNLPRSNRFRCYGNVRTFTRMPNGTYHLNLVQNMCVYSIAVPFFLFICSLTIYLHMDS